MACTVDVISIGTLSCNPFWNERGKVRASHATTTLIREGTTAILVDPSLPPDLLVHRLDERTGLKPGQIDVVFLTNFRPVHRRALGAFAHAQWLISNEERASVIASLTAGLESARGDEHGVSAPVEIEQELALVRRTVAAPDKLAPSVDLFPSPGAAVGSAALLVAGLKTVVVAGDAILSGPHFDHGRVYERCVDPEQARRSFADIVEVANVIIPGHDNLIVLP